MNSSFNQTVLGSGKAQTHHIPYFQCIWSVFFTLAPFIGLSGISPSEWEYAVQCSATSDMQTSTFMLHVLKHSQPLKKQTVIFQSCFRIRMSLDVSQVSIAHHWNGKLTCNELSFIASEWRISGGLVLMVSLGCQLPPLSLKNSVGFFSIIYLIIYY